MRSDSPLPELLDRLGVMPALLRDVAAALADVTQRRPAAGGFAFVEHAWHLADLEREGYGTRISRLDGAALARRGTQEGMGEITLGRVPRMMAAHDARHVEELAALVVELAPGASVLARLRVAAGVPGEPARA